MTTMMQQPQLSIRDCVFALHHILVKGFESPEITQRLTDFFYDRISKQYPDMEEFNFNDFDCSYRIKTVQYHPEIEQVIKDLYTEFVQEILSNPYTVEILSLYDYNHLIGYIINSGFINIAARECITFLNMSNGKENMVYKINLHN